MYEWSKLGSLLLGANIIVALKMMNRNSEIKLSGVALCMRVIPKVMPPIFQLKMLKSHEDESGTIITSGPFVLQIYFST